MTNIQKLWYDIPEPGRAKIQSFAVSFGLGAITAIGSLWTAYLQVPNHGGIPEFVTQYLTTTASLGIIFSAVAASYRVRQAGKRIEKTIILPDGRRAILVDTKPVAKDTTELEQQSAGVKV